MGWRPRRPQAWGPHGDHMGAMGMTGTTRGRHGDDVGTMGTTWGPQGQHGLETMETTQTTAMGTTWGPSWGYGDNVGMTQG